MERAGQGPRRTAVAEAGQAQAALTVALRRYGSSSGGGMRLLASL